MPIMLKQGVHLWCSLVGTGRVLTLPSAGGTQLSKSEHTKSMM